MKQIHQTIKSQRRMGFIFATAAGILVLTAVWELHLLRPGLCLWHSYMARKCYIKALKADPAADYQSQLLNAFDRHRNSLVRLGCLQKKVFVLKHIRYGTRNAREFWRRIEKTFPENIYVSLAYETDDIMYSTNVAARLVVYDKPQRIREWEEFVRNNDIPGLGEKVKETEETTRSDTR